jgi:hypothetical protein
MSDPSAPPVPTDGRFKAYFLGALSHALVETLGRPDLPPGEEAADVFVQTITEQVEILFRELARSGRLLPAHPASWDGWEPRLASPDLTREEYLAVVVRRAEVALRSRLDVEPETSYEQMAAVMVTELLCAGLLRPPIAETDQVFRSTEGNWSWTCSGCVQGAYGVEAPDITWVWEQLAAHQCPGRRSEFSQ